MTEVVETASPPPVIYTYARDWNADFAREVATETDRGAIIVAASLMDIGLRDLLINFLIAMPANRDELLDGPDAPLGSFSARINIAFRLGLISSRTCRELHLFRQMRNSCAHSMKGASFSDPSMRSRTLELTRSQPNLGNNGQRQDLPKGPRGDFLQVASWVLWMLHCQAQVGAQCKSREDNALYEDRVKA